MTVTTRLPLELCGIRIQRLRYDESLVLAEAALDADKLSRLYFINAHCINTAAANPAYRDAVASAEFVWNDGVGLELAGRAFGTAFPDNLNGTDWIPCFFDRLNKKRPSTRVFLLGARPEVMQNMESVFRRRWPSLVLSGTQHGFYETENAALDAITKANPEVLLVAMGVPRQELFLARCSPALFNAGVRLGIAGGAIVDFLTDTVPRAPAWVQAARLEWLYRFRVEPKRMFRRYMIGNAEFLGRVAFERLRRRA